MFVEDHLPLVGSHRRCFFETGVVIGTDAVVTPTARRRSVSGALHWPIWSALTDRGIHEDWSLATSDASTVNW